MPDEISEATTTPDEPATSGLEPDEEPVVTGTVFIMMIFLMALAALWGLMYLTLLER